MTGPSEYYVSQTREIPVDTFFSITELCVRSKLTGREYRRPAVLHPGGAGVVAVAGNAAVCVEQYRPAIGMVTTEIPAGRREPAEPPEQTARRELREEAGLLAGDLIPLCRLHAVPCFSNWVAEIYLATDVRDCVPPELTGELPTRRRLVRLDEVEELVHRGVLVDSKTIVGLLLARAMLSLAIRPARTSYRHGHDLDGFPWRNSTTSPSVIT